MANDRTTIKASEMRRPISLVAVSMKLSVVDAANSQVSELLDHAGKGTLFRLGYVDNPWRRYQPNRSGLSWPEMARVKAPRDHMYQIGRR